MASINTIISITDKISATLEDIAKTADRAKESLDGIGTSSTNSETALNKFSWSTFLKNAESAGRQMETIGRNMTLAITAPLVLFGKKMYDTSTSHETAFVGMTKTVDGTAEQYERLHQVALDISQTTPMGYVEAMGTMQTGGNLGVKIDDMEAFARSYAALESATDGKISGESGAELVADFLTIMEGGVAKIEPFGSALVHLGNNFNSTEDKILSMGKRMAAAADLAGFSSHQVLGMATAFSAVGIEAEAGGSAASKMIKQMQLSAEVGAKAQQAFGGEFKSAVEFQNHLAALKKADMVALAEDMGTTVEHIQSMADSWLTLEQFSEVSGKTSKQFIEDWKRNPAQGMIDFFYGLNKVDASGVESTLAMLDKMGITEIRQSNLVGAMASKPELFAQAILAAAQAYDENTAMWDEFAKQVDTQEAQNQMLANKFENSMADLGDNLVRAVQPALDKLNELLDAFNSLSEADQDKIITAFMIFAAGGPIVYAIGATVKAISLVAQGVTSIISNAGGWGASLSAFFNNPVFWGVAAGTALVLLISYLDSIPSKIESITTDLANIKITVDEESVNQTLAAIQQVQDAANLLKGGAVTEAAVNTSEAVKMGYGTSTMYGSALGFEAKRTEAEINALVTDYTGRIRAAEQDIINAQTDAERSAGLATVRQLESDMNAAISDARGRYAKTVSELFSGMAKQYPEMAEKLEKTVGQYDIITALLQMPDVGVVGADAFLDYQRKIFDMAKNAGYLEKLDMADITAYENIGNPLLFLTGLKEKVYEDIKNSTADLSENPVLAGFLQSILSAPTVTENLDFTALQGALAGMVGMLDFKQAAQQAVDSGKTAEFGSFLVLGLGQGVTSNAGLIAPSFASVRDAAVAALQSVFAMHSPSQLMASMGVYLPMGLAQGILAGQSAVINAAITTARSAIVAAKNELGIASPSKVFEAFGIFTGEGYVGGLISTYRMVASAMEHLVTGGTKPLWGLIDSYNQMELNDMMDSAEGKQLRVSDADMKKVRELAEREVINNFTTAELTVEFTANNNIKSDLDLDGIVTHLETVVGEALVAVAEGVHS